MIPYNTSKICVVGKLFYLLIFDGLLCGFYEFPKKHFITAKFLMYLS